MELEKAILTRRSARKFKDTPVSEEIIQKMLKMAQAAPSGGNGQGHVFGIVKNPQIKKALAEAAGNQMWIADAPVVIACCARLEEDVRTRPDDDFSIIVNHLRWGERFWEYLRNYPNWNDVACLMENATPLIPAEHMFLTAVEHGMSACFIGWLDVAKASEILMLPENVRCLFLLPIGYAAEAPKPKTLKTIDEISFRDTYK